MRAISGCEILCFGRTAFGESFNGGQIRQRTRIHRDGKLVWFEQLRLLGGSPAMKASLILANSTVCATLIAAGKAVPDALLHEAREGAGAIHEWCRVFWHQPIKTDSGCALPRGFE